MGYKTCHVLNSSLDATVCAKDCDSLKKQDFATTCKAKGGLYKCCIRRDKAFCHECRYLVWTYKMAKCKSITCKGSAVHYPSAPTLHLPCNSWWKVLAVETDQIKQCAGGRNT